jgi:hypothetical protein
MPMLTWNLAHLLPLIQQNALSPKGGRATHAEASSALHPSRPFAAF